jgi:hypothetical protein
LVDEYGVIEFEWDIDPSESALFVIEMQSGFQDRMGVLRKKPQQAFTPHSDRAIR